MFQLVVPGDSSGFGLFEPVFKQVFKYRRMQVFDVAGNFYLDSHYQSVFIHVDCFELLLAD
jgi:hypothetical protein